MTSPADDLLDQTQLASLLGLSRRHVSRLAAAGLLDDFEHGIPFIARSATAALSLSEPCSPRSNHSPIPRR